MNSIAAVLIISAGCDHREEMPVRMIPQCLWTRVAIFVGTCSQMLIHQREPWFFTKVAISRYFSDNRSVIGLARFLPEGKPLPNAGDPDCESGRANDMSSQKSQARPHPGNILLHARTNSTQLISNFIYKAHLKQPTVDQRAAQVNK